MNYFLSKKKNIINTFKFIGKTSVTVENLIPADWQLVLARYQFCFVWHWEYK